MSENYESKVIINIKSIKKLFKVTCLARFQQNKIYILILTNCRKVARYQIFNKEVVLNTLLKLSRIALS